jgi:hypothetical protein
MAQHDVPFVSQYTDIGDHEWRARGCGIAALKMAMEFWLPGRVPSLDTLLREGLANGAYRKGIGWTHGGLVQLARRHGLAGFNADYAENGPTPKSADDAWAALVNELGRGPVLASVYSHFDPASRDGHLVVVTGLISGLVAFNDPEEQREREGRRFLARDVFVRAFKRRYIVIAPGATGLRSA